MSELGDMSKEDETYVRQLERQRDELLAAGKALVERWDSPLWKDQPHTGEFIARLRDAVAKAEAAK